MSKESRDVRPYSGVGQFQRVLDAARLEAAGHRLEGGGRVTLSTRDFLSVPVRIEFGASEQEMTTLLDDLHGACAEADLMPEQVDFTVIAATRRLKRREIVFQRSIAALDPLDLPVTVASQRNRPVALQAPVGGCQIHTFLLLNQDLPRKPLRPARKGTWLAFCEFVIATSLAEVGFVPSELTDEVRREFGLSPQATRLVLCENPLDPASGMEDLAVYVDGELLRELATNPRTAASRRYQTELFLHAMQVVLMQAAVELQESSVRSFEDIDGSIVHQVIVQACRSGDDPGSHEQAMFRALKTRPSLAVAMLESAVKDVRQSTLEALKAGIK